MSLISIKDISFSYPQQNIPILKNVSLDINAGDYVAIIGKNGSGKTTLLRIIAGLTLATSGSVSIEENSLIGIVFQNPKDQIIASVISTEVAFGPTNLLLSKQQIESRVTRSLEVVGMKDLASCRTSELSLGQTQKVAFSSIIAMQPAILLLDEVTAMLDLDSRKELLNFIHKYHEEGHTIIHITHSASEIELATKIAVLDSGKLLHFGAKTSAYSYILPPPSIKKYDYATSEKTPVLVARNLCFYRQGKLVLDNINFALYKGTLTAITGKSGSGKTTLMELLCGLLQSTRGTINATSYPALCVQDSEAGLFKRYAADDVAFGARNNGVHGKKLLYIVKRAMDDCSLPFSQFASRQTTTLSGGQRRKVCLASIVALDRDILFFDEPTQGLDAQSQYAILQVLQGLCHKGKTVFFSTHKAEEVDYADCHFHIENARLNCLTQGFSLPKDCGALKELCANKNTSLITSLYRIKQIITATNTIPSSILSCLSPTVKQLLFLMLFVSSLCIKSILTLCIISPVILCYILVANVNIKNTLYTYIKVLPYLMLFTLFELVFYGASSTDTIYINYKFFCVTQAKLWRMLFLCTRVFCAMVCLNIFMKTIAEKDIIEGLSNLLKPFGIVGLPVKDILLIIGIIFRFLPMLIDEAVNIIKIQIIRGGLSKSNGFIARIKILLPLTVPLLLRTIGKAGSLADSINARYYK